MEFSKLAQRDYSSDILNVIINRSEDVNEALQNHMITPNLRAKMVDWMIEVLSSYKMSEECFFRSVKFMDLYFKKTPRKL
jgi:cyclin B